MSTDSQAYDGKAWAASLALFGLSLAVGYYGASVLKLSFVKTMILLAIVIVPIGYLYNWIAKRRGWSQLWSLDILFNILPFDLP